MTPKHPGEVLNELLEKEKMSVAQLTAATGVEAWVWLGILSKTHSLVAETAFALAKQFPNTSYDYWIDLQLAYDKANRPSTSRVNLPGFSQK